MKFDDMMTKMIDSMIPALTSSYTHAKPDISANDIQRISEISKIVMIKMMPRLKEEMYNTYAQIFTDAELLSMVEYYESTNGQSVLQKMPLVMQVYMQSIVSMSGEFEAEMEKVLCDKGMCSDKSKSKTVS